MTPPSDSLRRRYGFKLIGSGLGLGAGLVVSLVVPRSLGPAAYGDFQFLTSFFQRLVGFLGMGSPLALNNKVAQRPEDVGFTTFFAGFTILVAVAVAAVVAVVFALGLEGVVWPDQVPVFIVAAAVWALAMWGVQALGGVADALGLTVGAERLRVVQSAVRVVLISGMFLAGVITLGSLFAYHYVVLGLLAGLWIVLLRRSGYPLVRRDAVSRETIRTYAPEFYAYCAPLLTYSLAAFVAGAGERWLLQMFGGSVEQGFFGLGYQIGTICFLFGSAMAPLIQREFAVAHAGNDVPRMAEMFRATIPRIYAIVAMLGVFVAVFSDQVVLLFGGEAYRSAALPMAIIALYPIHQTYGQLSGAVLYATGQTSLYRDIGVVMAVLGLIVAYALLAEERFGGLDMGATGLAVKMVAVQFVTVNVQLYFNARLLGLRFSRYVAHQLAVIAVLGGAAFLSRWAGEAVIAPAVPGMIVAGLLFIALSVVALFAEPRLFGWHQGRRELASRFGALMGRMTARRGERDG